jgi:tetratricopeptide (TPR) repeat protein
MIRSRFAVVVCFAVALAAFAAPAPATAQSKKDVQRAEQLNGEARIQFKSGNYDGAADLFMQVYDLVKTPAAVFNAARAREAGKRLVEAKTLYELYLRIEKSPEGLADARQRIAEIEASLKLEEQRKAEQEAAQKAAAEEAARKAAEDAAKKAAEDAARAAAEDAAKKAAEAAEKERKLAGATFVPPTGVSSEDAVRAVGSVLTAVAEAAQAAGVAPVHPIADYIGAEMARGVQGPCDFHCQLGVARGLGSAYALTTSLRQDGGLLRLRLVIWRTTDATDAGQAEAAGTTLPGLQERAKRAAGDVWNGVRNLAVVPVPPPPNAQPLAAGRAWLAIEVDPPGSAVAIDEADMGPAPLVAAVSVGTHRIRAQKPGFHLRAGLVAVEAGSQRTAIQLPPALAPEVAPAGTIPAPVPATPSPPAATATPAARVTPPTTANPAPLPATKPSPTAPENASPMRATAKPSAAPSAVAPTTAANAPASAAGTPSTPSENTVHWGVVGTLDNGLGFSVAPDDTIRADASLGYGGYAHIGWGPRDGSPYVSLCLGARYFSYQGLSARVETPLVAKPFGMAYMAGVIVPKLSGLMGTIAYHSAEVENNFSAFQYWTWGLRIVPTKGLFYFAIGIDSLLASNRDITLEPDEFGAGPRFRIGAEIGVNLGGVQLSR